MQAGSAVVHVTTELDNSCRDHRLRALVPAAPTPATSSTAECAFAVVERGLVAEGGPNEVGYPMYPSRRFVVAGGLTVLHEGLLEYELVDIDDGGAGALALTLLRATGLLSNGPMASRPLPAGPFTRTDGAQMIGPHTFRYALLAGDDPTAAYAAVDDAFLPMIVTRAAGGGTRESDAVRSSSVQGAVVSSVLRDAGQLDRARVQPHRPCDHRGDRRATTAGWSICGAVRSSRSMARSRLEPWRIATAQLRD